MFKEREFRFSVEKRIVKEVVNQVQPPPPPPLEKEENAVFWGPKEEVVSNFLCKVSILAI